MDKAFGEGHIITKEGCILDKGCQPSEDSYRFYTQIMHLHIRYVIVSKSHELACSLMIPIGDFFFMKHIKNCMMILFADTEY